RTAGEKGMRRACPFVLRRALRRSPLTRVKLSASNSRQVHLVCHGQNPYLAERLPRDSRDSPHQDVARATECRGLPVRAFAPRVVYDSPPKAAQYLVAEPRNRPKGRARRRTREGSR